jgi:hypothetical protein
VRAITETAAGFTKRVQNPIGVLKTTIPGTIAASIERRRDRLRSEAAVKLAEDQHTATIILENPESYTPEDLAWARNVPIAKTKGAGQ